MLDEYSAEDFLERNLYEAIFNRDGRAAVASILRGADPSSVIMESPAIHHAITMKDEELLECLIANGADVHAVSELDGLAPLHLAIREEFVAGVEILLKAPIDIELRDNDGYPPLFYAVQTPNKEIFDMLLASGADVNGKDDEGRTALHVTNDHWQVVELLERGADVNARDFLNRTPLEMEILANFSSYCSETGNPIVTEFLRWGAAIDERTLDAVFFLARDKECELELFTTVFRGTGHVDSRDGCLRTALHYVAGTGRIEVVRELLECGADVNARDSGEYTPLHFAVGLNAGIEVVSELLLKGAGVNAKNSWGRTPLHVAVLSTSELVVEHLLGEGADINALDNAGESPLHGLLPYDSSSMLRLLIKHSVLRNYDTRTEYVKSKPWRKDFLSCLQCMSEVEDMKRFRVGRDLSLYDVALGDEWDISFTREIYDRIVKDKFPMYSNIVLSRLSRKVKAHLSDHTNDVSLFLLDLFRKSNICINQHVLIDIVKYLSDKDCLNFYIAGC